ncbi:MAG TPA: hypothetical protein PK605_00130 [Ignavibacteria bacterium]|nr:hypothetical protein [Bacteroidota bacterium]HRE10814.1 hypothetical protein [Ignavibacteria bacterium]HRF65943.1 hypothetical protein [Ignavibacteria bacterium]HRJ02785.1 hypothetical protein [Ignavibacteria bacterium]
MKTASLLLFLIFAFSLFGCSGTKVSRNTNDLKTSKYFRVLADADDDPIFVKLQDDLGIVPKMERYTIVVDVRDNNTAMQYVLFGDEYNPTRFSWTQLSEQVRTGLLNWTGSNKERLD